MYQTLVFMTVAGCVPEIRTVDSNKYHVNVFTLLYCTRHNKSWAVGTGTDDRNNCFLQSKQFKFAIIT